ncbi:Na/Pi symporter [Priestia endophytica]|uniref:Phosphate:Na+ symporter n=1 Tax=Priestia endophytica DSM 13796 TaxID=1121089 RepID=A0A1I5WGN0_9BACI|nr:Na/Pi symporter [Priestia endophytica]KYG36125.1 hypothetical protein AZF06_02710 [Priestia endophytica]SFQ18835.1 phosphate:Na+ symporter [Priestia endophytica DSM 13796]
MIEVLSFFAVFLTIFLFGMLLLKIGLQNFENQPLRNQLSFLTKTSVHSFLTGILITFITQSSSVVIIIAIVLVSARFLTLHKALSVTLGANIGAWIPSFVFFPVSNLVLPLLLLGTLLIMLSSRKSFSIGVILFGLGCLTVSLNGCKELSHTLFPLTFVQDSMNALSSNELLGSIIGVLLGGIIQSHTFLFEIVLEAIKEQALSFKSSLFLLWGISIGTSLFPLVASIGSNKEGKFLALFYILINTLGTSIFLPLFYAFHHVLSMLFFTEEELLRLFFLGSHIFLAAVFLPLLQLIIHVKEKKRPYRPT